MDKFQVRNNTKQPAKSPKKSTSKSKKRSVVEKDDNEEYEKQRAPSPSPQQNKQKKRLKKVKEVDEIDKQQKISNSNKKADHLMQEESINTDDNKMFKFIDDESSAKKGLNNRGDKTLQEFGIKSVDKDSHTEIRPLKNKKAPIKLKDSSDDDLMFDPLLGDYKDDSESDFREEDETLKHLSAALELDAKRMSTRKNNRSNKSSVNNKASHAGMDLEIKKGRKSTVEKLSDSQMDLEDFEFKDRKAKENKKIAAAKRKASRESSAESNGSTGSNAAKGKRGKKTAGKASTIGGKKSISGGKSSTSIKDDATIELPLSGMTIVVTGEYNCCDNRDELIEVMKNLGAKVTAAISNKTTYLISGHRLIDGRPPEESNKYKNAVKKGTAILTEDDLDSFLNEKTGQSQDQLMNGGSIGFGLEVIQEEEAKEEILDVVKQVFADKKEAKNEKKADFEYKNNSNYKPKNVISEKVDNLKVAQPEGVMYKKEFHGAAEKNTEEEHELWTKKYAPVTLSDIMGNQDVIRKLRSWLNDWDTVVIKGIKKDIKPNFSKGGFGGGNFAQSNPNARAAMLSGPPGIGKTTVARLIAAELNYSIIEQNASDMRNKKSISGFMCAQKNNSTFSKGEIKKTLIVMDECDGMSSDRGGSASQIETIKDTKVPIICICNERQHPKMRTLANHCLDLRFAKPNKTGVIKRLKVICGQEDMKCDDNSLDFLIGLMGNDIRQVINFLQIWRKKSDTFVYSTMKTKANNFKKDESVMISNFDAGTKLMRKQEFDKLTFRERMNLFFVDYSLIPLLFHENYLDTVHDVKNQNNTLKNMVKASNSIAEGDVINKHIRTNMEWKLLDAYGFKSTLYPAQKLCQGIGFAKFPEFFGKFSTTKKVHREVRELRMSLMGNVSATRQAVKFDYAPHLMQLIRMHMAKGEKDDQDTVLEVYENYGLTPELVKEHQVEILYNPDKIDFMSKVDKKSKANMTKLYNAKYKESLVAKKKKKRVVAEEDMLLETEEDFEASDTPSDSEQYSVQEMVTKGAKKGNAKGKANQAKTKGPAKGAKGKKK